MAQTSSPTQCGLERVETAGPQRYVEIVREVFAAWRALIGEVIAEAQSRGPLRDCLDAQRCLLQSRTGPDRQRESESCR